MGAIESRARSDEAIEETGAAVFPQLVWAHYQWERKLHTDGGSDPALEQAYRQKLTDFQQKKGRLEQVYWSTREPSAVAMTLEHGTGLLDIQVDDPQKPYYYGFFAFFAGFSERFATLVLGAAERRFVPGEQRQPRSGAHEDP